MNYFYKKVFVIDGNHEYYGEWIKIDRYKELKEITKKLKNVVFLDENDVIDVEGIKIAGRMMMYNIEDRSKDYQFFNNINVATGYPHENKSDKPYIETIYIKKGEN